MRPRLGHESLLGKISWSAVATSTFAGGNFMATVIVARTLTPAEVGHLLILLWLASALSSLFGFGIAETLTRYLAASSDILGRAWLISVTSRATVALTIPIAAAAAGTLRLLDYSLGSLPAMLAAIVGLRLWSYYRAVSIGVQAFRTLAGWTTASSLCQVALVALLASSYGVEGALFGWGLSGCILAIPLLRHRASSCSRSTPIDRSATSTIVRYGATVWIGVVVSTLVWQRAELLFISRYLPPAEAGYFGIGLALAGILALGGSVFGTALMPHFTALASAEVRESLNATYSFMLRAIAYVLLPITSVLVVHADSLIRLVYGPAYEGAVPVFQLLAVTAAFAAVSGVSSAALHAKARPGFIVVSGILAIIATCAYGVLVVPTYGYVAGTACKVVVQLSLVIAGMIYAGRTLRIETPWRQLTGVALAATAAGAIGSLPPWRDIIAVSAGISLLTFTLGAKLLRVWSLPDALKIDGSLSKLPLTSNRIVRSLLLWLLLPNQSLRIGIGAQ